MKNERRLSKEFVLFFTFILINASFIFMFRWNPTMDGPAHLYNARLLQQIIFEKNQFLLQFLELNPEPVPNWMGHLLMMLLLEVGLPPFLTEKVILLLICCGIPLAFRNLLTTLNSQFLSASYLIVPFVYSYVFGLGFYNFYLGILFLILSLHYWWSFQHSASVFRSIAFTIFSTACYFSHLVTFGTLGLIILLEILWSAYAYFKIEKNRLSITYLLSKKSLILLLLPFVFLGWHFVVSRGSFAADAGLGYLRMKDWLWEMGALVIYGEPFEKSAVRWMGLCFLLLFLLAAWRVFKAGKTGSAKAHLWLVAAALMLLMSCILPSEGSGGGYITIRLVLFFWIFLVVWLSHVLPKNWAALGLVAAVSLLQLSLLPAMFKGMRWLEKPALAMEAAAAELPPNSLVVPLRHSGIWLDGHFSNYLGVDKPVAVLENYEVATGYFPLVWKHKTLFLESFSDSPNGCLTENHTDFDGNFYIVQFGSEPKNDSCASYLQSILKISNFYEDDYILIYKNAGKDAGVKK